MRKWNFYTTNEIKPEGWMKTQLEIQAKGLCGNLDKVWRDVKDSAWIGGNCEGWERVPYWLDGFIPLAYLLEDRDMITRAKKYIDAIISFQKPDGWICPCEDSEIEHYDTWAVILISKVLTVYCQCSKDERIPKILYNVLKNYYDLLKSEKIRLFGWGQYRWFEAFIAIEFLYDIYKEEWIKDLGRILKSRGIDYNKLTEKWKVPLNKWELDTHIVNLTMMLKQESIYCDIAEEEYTDNAEKLYDILYKYNGMPAGIFTGDECLSGVSPIQGAELCSVVELMYSYEHLYAYTGDRKWAERLEMVAFNALPAANSDDMWTHQYVQMTNQIACQKFPGKSVFRTNNSEAHLFGLEPNYGCCTANFGQGWPKFALTAFLHNGDRIINAIPIPSRLETEDLYIKLETEYPFKNKFKYTIDSKKDFTFIVPVPSFANDVTVDGKPAENSEIHFEIKANEKREINIEFKVVPCFEKREYGLWDIKCGSLLFALPIEYEKKMIEYVQDGVERKFPYCDYEYIPKSDWNYGYCQSELELIPKEVGEIPFSSENPPVTVRAKARKIDWGYEDGYETVCAKLPKSREPIGKTEEKELYPYGCAKLRMTELPLI